MHESSNIHALGTVSSVMTISLSIKLATYPSPKPTLTLSSHLRKNIGLGEGKVDSFPETFNNPGKLV